MCRPAQKPQRKLQRVVGSTCRNRTPADARPVIRRSPGGLGLRAGALAPSDGDGLRDEATAARRRRVTARHRAGHLVATSQDLVERVAADDAEGVGVAVEDAGAGRHLTVAVEVEPPIEPRAAAVGVDPGTRGPLAAGAHDLAVAVDVVAGVDHLAAQVARVANDLGVTRPAQGLLRPREQLPFHRLVVAGRVVVHGDEHVERDAAVHAELAIEIGDRPELVLGVLERGDGEADHGNLQPLRAPGLEQGPNARDDLFELATTEPGELLGSRRLDGNEDRLDAGGEQALDAPPG